MIMHSTDSQSSWELDYQKRVNPSLMNRLLYQAVPVLKWTGWEITKVELGFCESCLPLVVPTTNQHGTHQAALISLSADYTGGMAFTTLLSHTPLTGIHPGAHRDGASLWLASMEVKYERPSTSHLRATCRIDERTKRRIQKRFFEGRPAIAMLEVEFWSEDNERVAVANMRYFAQSTEALHETDSNGRRSAIAQLNLKTSARIIAGLRSLRQDPQGRLAAHSDGTFYRFDSAHDQVAAGTHGLLQAKRLQGVLPQLAKMVDARTRHGDAAIREMDQLEQLVMLGCGLDMRPLRMAKDLQDVSVFELDLPEMIDERQRVISRIQERQGEGASAVSRYAISADFLKDDVGTLLINHPQFSQTAHTFVIFEGCSMYFDRQQNQRLLRSITNVLRNPGSRIWMDLVTPEVISKSTSDPNIHDFVHRMEMIGEKFVFGPDEAKPFLSGCGLLEDSCVTAGDFVNSDDPTMHEYRFVVGRRNASQIMASPPDVRSESFSQS